MKLKLKETISKILDWIHNPVLHNSVANTDTMLNAYRDDTGVGVGFGIGTCGVNHGVFSRQLNRWLIYADNDYTYIPNLQQIESTSGNLSVGANGTLWFTVAPPANCKPIAVIGWYFIGVSGGYATYLNAYSVSWNGSNASFAVANINSSACTFKCTARFLAYVK